MALVHNILFLLGNRLHHSSLRNRLHPRLLHLCLHLIWLLMLLFLLMRNYLRVHLLYLLFRHPQHPLLRVAPQLLPLAVAGALLLGGLALVVHVAQPLFEGLTLGETVVGWGFQGRLVLLYLQGLYIVMVLLLLLGRHGVLAGGSFLL